MITPADIAAVYDHVPYAKELGVDFVEATPGRVLCALRERDGVLNHLGSVHAGALYMFAETAAGAAVISALNVMTYVPMVKDGKIDYLRLARGRLTVEARLDLETARGYAATADREGKVFFPYSVEIRDPAGAVCAAATFTYRLRKRS